MEAAGRTAASSLGETNLDRNLITVQTCICAVVRGTLRRGGNKAKIRNLLQQGQNFGCITFEVYVYKL